jgi:hypothetical protein
MINIPTPVPLTEVRATPVSPPLPFGDRAVPAAWQGVPHGDLLDGLLEEARNRNWKPKVRAAALSRHGADLTASISVAGVPECTWPGLAPDLGVQASNAMRRGLRFYCGAWVRPTKVGLVTHVFRDPVWRYNRDFRLGLVCREAWTYWHARARQLGAARIRLMADAVDLDWASVLLARAAQRGGLAWRDIPRVLGRYRERSWCSAWELLMAASHSVIAASPERQLERLLTLYTVLSKKE